MGKKRNRLSRKLLYQCLAANLAYAVGIFLVIGLAIAFCNQVIWYWEDPIYRALLFVRDNMPFFVVPILLCGWLPITHHYLLKLLKQLEEVSQAAEQLAQTGEVIQTLEPVSGFPSPVQWM